MQTKLLSTTTNKRFYKDVASLKKTEIHTVDTNFNHTKPQHFQDHKHGYPEFMLLFSQQDTPTYSSLVIFIGGTKIASLPLSGEDELSATEPRMNYHSKSNQVLMEPTFELKPVAITITANATELSIWLQQGWGLVLAT